MSILEVLLGVLALGVAFAVFLISRRPKKQKSWEVRRVGEWCPVDYAFGARTYYCTHCNGMLVTCRHGIKYNYDVFKSCRHCGAELNWSNENVNWGTTDEFYES